jgi:superfamily II DNA or RNA helicase
MTATGFLLGQGATVERELAYYRSDNDCRSVCFELPHARVILDFGFFDHRDRAFPYDLYTEFQNGLVAGHRPVYRFLSTASERDIRPWLDGTVPFSTDVVSVLDRGMAVCDATPLEHFFEERFCEVYGADAISYLRKEYALQSLGGENLFLDYLVTYIDGSKVAVEENGVSCHHPQLIGKQRYLHQLEKQNICAYLGIRLYRFSSEDCRFPDHVDDQIRQFFGNRKTFKVPGVSVSRSVSLYRHQEEALEDIRRKRERSGGKPVAVLEVFPTATGKSKIVEQDLARFLFRHPDARVLVVGPTARILQDWLDRVSEQFFGTEITYGTDRDCQILVGTYHTLWHLQDEVPPDHFAYIVVDEAHHAVAPMTRQALEYFQPGFLIGLTATPNRLDQKRLEDVFGSYRTTLDLEQAIEQGLVANIRAFRVQTNLDLSRVRFNGRQYVNADLERAIHIDSRNHLIVSVLQRYFLHTTLKGLVFCVTVSHAQEVARLLDEAGIPAAAVSGRTRHVEQVLDRFRKGEIRFLCSCNLISEGWDVPEIGVLVMARPTLSKALYLQQLGRGLRTTETKNEVFVIDVVDQYGALARPWSSHAILGVGSYVPFGLMVGTRYKVGDVVQVLGLCETVREIVPVSTMTFERQYAGYLELERAARMLYVGTMTLRKWVTEKSVQADLVIPFGSRKLLYFKQETIAAIREQKHLEEHTDETLVEDFFAFVRERNYTFSFKMVFLKAMLTLCDANGEVSVSELLDAYRNFYLDRIEANLPVDRPSCIYTEAYLADTVSLKRNMLANPFEKFERKRFVYYGKEIGRLAFNPILWRNLTEEDKASVLSVIEGHLEEYYREMGGVVHHERLR